MAGLGDSGRVVQGADSAGRSILALLVLSVKDALKFDTAFDVARTVLLGSVRADLPATALWRLIEDHLAIATVGSQ